MGKWAQYRKRGGGGPLPSVLGPPPAPVLVFADPALQIFAQGFDDTAGLYYIQLRVGLGGAWTTIDELQWYAFLELGSYSEGGTSYYRIQERGNHIAYEGLSAPSNVLGPYE